jgi:DNA-directed RNA polymerase specialized sigma24 family protein
MKQEFLKLYDRNVDVIFRYCLRETHNRVLAKKITEEAFKKMWDYQYPDTSMTEMDTTLRSIATRLLRHHKQKTAELIESINVKFS